MTKVGFVFAYGIIICYIYFCLPNSESNFGSIIFELIIGFQFAEYADTFIRIAEEFNGGNLI